MRWKLLEECMPDPDKYEYVLIYTEGYDFSGLQYFEVKAEYLNENYFEDEADQPEECRLASHWLPLPFG